jgi:predicted RNA-binding Zn-ribbon protein involved in translation (DUF1610 family)
MNFFRRFISGISVLYSRLTSINKKEKLSGFSLFVIIILDILLLSALFTGLSDHSSQFTPPYKYFPAQYRQILLEQTWDIPSQQIDSLQSTVLHNKNRYYKKDKRNYNMHPACEKIDSHVEKIKKDTKLENLFELRSKAKRHQASLKKEISELNGLYNTSLLERIVDKKSQSEISNITNKIKTKTRQINKLELEIQKLEKDVFSNKNVSSFLNVIKEISPAKKKELTSEIRSLNFWYPVKLLFYQFIFLFPLLLITYLWSLRTLRKESYIQTLIATHLMVIISIPILIRVIDIITEIIPNRLLKDFLALLQKLHIIALWHYFLILLLVVIGIYLIRFIQKKAKERIEFTPMKLIDGQCHACCKKLPFLSTPYCPYCGETQMLKCKKCDSLKFSIASFCHTCGEGKGSSS